jgi:hypothetical protein
VVVDQVTTQVLMEQSIIKAEEEGAVLAEQRLLRLQRERLIQEAAEEEQLK